MTTGWRGYIEGRTDNNTVTQQGWTYEQVLDALAQIYREHPLAVAIVCDESLDKSGRLLGEVRNRARKP